MVINRGEMKRKRREECPSPLLDESPKRTKVHAQRKFAQGSNVNSPVITPVKEIERQEIDVLPEPVELLPIKRPNTEDFLTFLCFRGTPILPPSLNFFNTASIVDTNGQVHEIKSESPKNGPIDTSSITKAGSGSSERPFIAFGVRKRADPIVISRQMDKKRRHALALQALRRKYQEQRMAKIRAVTISKLSEKVTNKTLVRSNSVSKNEVVAKKTAIPKAKEVIKDERMTTRSVKAQIKQKMCLRSFRGRFVQRELQFRNVKKRPLPVKKLPKVVKEEDPKKNESEYSSDDERPLSKGSPKVIQKIAKKTAPGPRKPVEISFRITRSNKFLNTKMVSRRQQIKQRMLLSTPKTIVKPRTLRSHTGQKPKKLFVKTEEKKDAEAKEVKESTPPVKKQTKIAETKEVKKEESEKKGKVDAIKKVGNKNVESLKKATSPVTLSKNKPEKSTVVKKEIESAKKPKVVPKPTSQNVENKSVSEAKKEILPKKKPPVVLKKNVSKVIEKKENKKEIVKSEETDKKVEEQKDNMELRTSQRPTRKTKEAAAIYMEILSHKLVNDGTVDDDNVSIDSFPELPNVKKTEQRENELKAKAKSNKPDSESTEKRNVKKEVEVVESKVLRSGDKKKGNECKKIEKKEEKKTEEPKKKVEETDRKTRSANLDKAVTSSLEKMKEVELKVHINPIDVETENTKVKTETKEPPAKKKCNEKVPEPTNSESDTSEDSIKKKVEEKNKKSNEVEVTRRQTRNSSQVIKHVETDDSDESFRADIRIPRKKQITRSKVKNIESEEEGVKKSLRVNSRSYKECTSSDSDHSTTSDVNVKPVRSLKNKKFTKTRGQQKEDESFSDSDEEPLSKLTQNKKESKESPPKEIKIQAEVKPKEKEKVTENEEKESFVKPKRECAKRPQNYLPMLSSSDEEETYFHGFKVKDEKQRKTVKVENSCAHVATTSDLSCKDVGRRFGKGKVNMSTEQIEKWLKDSAMAGSSVKNENDEMLKFGEKIPTETSHSVASSIDTEKLKSLLITNVDKTETDPEKKEVSPKIETEKDTTKPIKPSLADRKLIFRNKDKGGRVNVNAFSANNENSVYAFEETEDLMKTPFRRPARRPSSTATSRSEDETTRFDDLPKTCQFRRPPLLKQDSSKSEEDKSNEDNSFNAPLQPQKAKLLPMIDKKPLLNTSMTPPTSQKPSNLKHPTKPPPRQLDLGDDAKYKVPSSPSASSSSSAKLYKRQNIKLRTSEVLPVKLPDFPVGGACGQLVEAPTFHPTEKEFQDPLEYIEKIRSKAEQFGICRIVPPATFKPECKVTDDMRFTAYNQFVHKMLHRWGPNFKELMAIKKYLSTQNISLTHPPWIGGMEIDLPRLYQTVQSLGGLKEVIEKKKWPKVSDAMKIPKSAQDRVTKLDDIYCKYLLPYDTLSPAEREKLFDEVETEWAKRESKSLLKAQQNVEDNMTEGESESDDEAEECIVKGRSMALNAFYRIARNTMSMWFKNSEPLAEEVEQEFWKHVTLKQNHICVHSGSIDSGNWGYGFAVSKNSPFARHSWNLKVLTNNSGSILRSMGPVMGVTVPTLHVGMVFSSCCWYRDPHSLPWIEYLHTGGSKIWYGVPDSTSSAFHTALKTLVPNYCRNKALWLPSDTVMVPPNLLVENGVSLSRIVQEPGQFIVVFPKVFTSSLSTGYVVSESVYFAPLYWLQTGRTVFNELRESCEPSMFSFDRLLLSIVNDARSNVEVLKQIIPAVQELCDKEKSAREKINSIGITATEKLPLPETSQVRKKKKLQSDDGEYECDICRMNLFVSMVTESQEDAVYCLDHAAEQIEMKKIQSKNCKLTYTYDIDELDALVEKVRSAINNKMQKKVPNKFAGLPTLLK